MSAVVVKPPRVWARPTSTPGKLCDCGPCLDAVARMVARAEAIEALLRRFR